MSVVLNRFLFVVFFLICGGFVQAKSFDSFKKPSDKELKKSLSPLQFDVTQNDGTEKPFKNEYWQNKDDGIYVDIVSGEPLFSSADKYDSGTGWPSFMRPLVKANIVETKEYRLLGSRTEVRSKHADSHLGHVFKDGPEPTGLRYCMNSAALKFIPARKLEDEGYGEFKSLFAKVATKTNDVAPVSLPKKKDEKTLELATFAGGCFWCMEPPFENLDGVKSVISGFSGGRVPNPSYKQVSAGGTGHAEVVQISFDPGIISYEKLLDIFWHNIDPTDSGGQFVDRGQQYRSAIFFHSDEQKKLADLSKEKWAKSGRFEKPLVTEITGFTSFYKAEDYHQDYYKINPVRYKYYRYRSGRDQFLKKTWKTQK